MRSILTLLVIALSLSLTSCEKEPGEGGLATIKGKVYIQEYNGNCTELRDQYYGIDEDVYIIAGDDPSYFERVKTGPDGTFWFRYLREGKYKVYALSENCDTPGDLEAVILEVEIDHRKQDIVTPDITVIR